MKRKYKALILDADGTIMPNQRYALPSARVTKAINSASKVLHVGLATSRPYKDAANILNHLKLSGYSIINGGSQIIDTKTNKIIWQQPMSKEDIKIVCEATDAIVKKKFWVNVGDKDVPYRRGRIPKNAFQVYLMKFTQDEKDAYVAALSHIPTIAIHSVPSWTPGLVDIIVTHALATKQHGVFEVAKLLKIETHDIIGVGDGYNDFPLLMACGLKVAMGNAVSDLKEIADYIAPTVEEDGVADVIEKFIL